MKYVALVTGASGYTGMHLCKALLEKGCTVHAVVRESSNLERLKKITDDRVIIHVYDAAADNLLNIFHISCPDVVYHLAAMVSSANGYNVIQPLLSSNIIFGTKVIEAMLQVGCKKLVNTSTSWVHYDQSQYSPVCLYAASKMAFVDIIKFYQDAYGLEVITLELCDSFGVDDNRKKLLNLIRDSVRSGKKLATTQGMQKISLLYIDDLIDGFIVSGNHLVENNNVYGCYILPAEEIMTLRELVDRIENICKVKVNISWGKLPYRPREVMSPWDKGTVLPGWRQNISFDDGIRMFMGCKQ